MWLLKRANLKNPCHRLCSGTNPPKSLLSSPHVISWSNPPRPKQGLSSKQKTGLSASLSLSPLSKSVLVLWVVFVLSSLPPSIGAPVFRQIWRRSSVWEPSFTWATSFSCHEDKKATLISISQTLFVAREWERETVLCDDSSVMWIVAHRDSCRPLLTSGLKIERFGGRARGHSSCKGGRRRICVSGNKRISTYSRRKVQFNGRNVSAYCRTQNQANSALFVAACIFLSYFSYFSEEKKIK